MPVKNIEMPLSHRVHGARQLPFLAHEQDTEASFHRVGVTKELLNACFLLQIFTHPTFEQVGRNIADAVEILLVVLKATICAILRREGIIPSFMGTAVVQVSSTELLYQLAMPVEHVNTEDTAQPD